MNVLTLGLSVPNTICRIDVHTVFGWDLCKQENKRSILNHQLVEHRNLQGNHQFGCFEASVQYFAPSYNSHHNRKLLSITKIYMNNKRVRKINEKYYQIRFCVSNVCFIAKIFNINGEIPVLPNSICIINYIPKVEIHYR